MAYTDGTFEAPDRTGRPLGPDAGPRRPSPPNWPEYIRATVDLHQSGRSQDHVPVAALTFGARRPMPALRRSALASA